MEPTRIGKKMLPPFSSIEVNKADDRVNLMVQSSHNNFTGVPIQSREQALSMAQNLITHFGFDASDLNMGQPLTESDLLIDDSLFENEPASSWPIPQDELEAMVLLVENRFRRVSQHQVATTITNRDEYLAALYVTTKDLFKLVTQLQSRHTETLKLDTENPSDMDFIARQVNLPLRAQSLIGLHLYQRNSRQIAASSAMAAAYGTKMPVEHQDLLREALTVIDSMLSMYNVMMSKVDHANSFYDADTIMQMNKAPGDAASLGNKIRLALKSNPLFNNGE